MVVVERPWLTILGSSMDAPGNASTIRSCRTVRSDACHRSGIIECGMVCAPDPNRDTLDQMVGAGMGGTRLCSSDLTDDTGLESEALAQDLIKDLAKFKLYPKFRLYHNTTSGSGP